MKLSELEPQLFRIERRVEPYRIQNNEGVVEDAVGPRLYLVNVDTIAEADGIMFLCPLCFKNNNGNVGTHSCQCIRPSIPQSPDLTGPGRWELVGTGYHDLSLVSNPTSVQLLSGCKAHFTVSNGEVTFN